MTVKPLQLQSGRTRTNRKTHTVFSTKFMVVSGTLGTGFEFYGLFDDIESAERWVRHNLKPGTLVRIEEFNHVRDGA